jgi:hypothetical protein
MACSNAREMFDLFLNSERIRDDIIRELKFSDPNLMIVVRNWDETLNPLFEFRGFVCHHNLCAITQYDTRWFVEDLLKNRDHIRNAMQEFFVAKIRPRFAVKDSLFADGDYCVDFAVTPGDVFEVKIVELNRLSVTTGTGLFDWDDDHDVLSGKGEFAFRIVEEWPVKRDELTCWLGGPYLAARERLRGEIARELR